MGFTDLEGRLVRLELVGASKLALLHERLAIPAVWAAAGCDEAPPLARLEKKLFTYGSLVAWEIHPRGVAGPIGYVGIVSYSGPPYLWVDPFEDPPPRDSMREAAALVVPAFFRCTDGDRLFVHLPREREEAARRELLEAGFTPVDEVVFQDPAATASYLLDRHAYEVYRGDDPASHAERPHV